MSLRRLVLIVTATFALNLRADYETRVTPSQPTSRDAIKVVTWPGCSSDAAQITLDGSQIIISYRTVGGCIAAWAPVPRVVWIGPLAGGHYELVVVQDGRENARVPIDVRGVDPFEVFPPGAPTSGGRVNVDPSIPINLASKVFVDGIEAPWVRIGETPPTFMAPPHAPGIVDVTIVSNRRTHVAPHALKYYEPSDKPDRFVFTPILFPLAYQGVGVGGSQWRTENVVVADKLVPAVVHRPLDTRSRNDGAVLWIGRGQDGLFGFSSRISNTTRPDAPLGIEVPVVRLSDFREFLTFLGPPVAPGYRVMLRLWSEDEEGSVSIGIGFKRVDVNLTAAPDGLPFASIDLTELVSNFARSNPLSVYVGSYPRAGRFWGVLSITNNETHAVTLVLPQRTID